LRLLASANFDSRALLSVVLAGDGRLADLLRRDELRPLDSDDSRCGKA
jgi:general secretion pathway protein A